MTDIFVIRNQLGHYWGKAKLWVDGSEPKTIMKLKHSDEAINTLFELSSKDIELRGEIIEAELNKRGEPLVEASENPLPAVPGEPVIELEAENSEVDSDAESASPAEPETSTTS